MRGHKTVKRRSLSRRTRKTSSLGFILLRHVNSIKTDSYWKESYKCIRQYYPENKVVIIDDNSDDTYLTELELYKTQIIKSEFPGRGELLPYYYYSRNKWFDRAVIVHDSVFINTRIRFPESKCTFLWDFNTHTWDKPRTEMGLIRKLSNHEDLLEIYKNTMAWHGCFGAMSVIQYRFLRYLDKKYDLSMLLESVHSRRLRMAFERVFACIIQANTPRKVLLGDIHDYNKLAYKYTYENYINNKDNNEMPLVKIWTGR